MDLWASCPTSGNRGTDGASAHNAMGVQIRYVATGKPGTGMEISLSSKFEATLKLAICKLR